MEDLIKALQIFLKYEDSRWPTSCEHGALYVLVKARKVSAVDIEALDALGFEVDKDTGHFRSDRFGSA